MITMWGGVGERSKERRAARAVIMWLMVALVVLAELAVSAASVAAFIELWRVLWTITVTV